MTDSYKKAVAKGMKESATYIFCEVCNQKVLDVSGSGKYCFSCAKEVQKEQSKRHKQSEKYKKYQKEVDKTRDRKDYYKSIGHKNACKKYAKTENGKKKINEYREKYKPVRNLKHKQRVKVDLNYKLGVTIRGRIKQALIKEYKSSSSFELLGCNIEFLKKYLELKFEPGMDWDNHGLFGWHIDHIIPCDSFDLTNLEEQKKCFHYTNLQPLWSTTRLAKIKGSKKIGNLNKATRVTIQCQT